MTPMPEQTPAERALSCSYVAADGVCFDVDDLSVVRAREGGPTLVYRLTLRRPDHSDERWEVALPWADRSWDDVFTSPSPPADRLQMLVHLVRTHLEEWWDTRAYNRRSAKLGRRLP